MDKNIHRGPDKGYNSRAKQAYRKDVWSSMTDAIKIANESDGIPYYILMLPGLSTTRRARMIASNKRNTKE